MDLFTESEIKGRLKFNLIASKMKLKSLIDSVTYTKRYCAVDALLHHKDRYTAVEIKNITSILPTYFIKVKKYDNIKRYCKLNKIRKCWYAVFCNNDVYLVDLLSLPQHSKLSVKWIYGTNERIGERIPTPVYEFSVDIMTHYTLDHFK